MIRWRRRRHSEPRPAASSQTQRLRDLNANRPEGRHPFYGTEGFANANQAQADAVAHGMQTWQSYICWLGHYHWKRVSQTARAARAARVAGPR